MTDDVKILLGCVKLDMLRFAHSCGIAVTGLGCEDHHQIMSDEMEPNCKRGK